MNLCWRGRARTQVPTTRNYTLELPTLGVIAGVNPVEVQWKGLILRGPPSWSRCLSRQVSLYLKKTNSHPLGIVQWICLKRGVCTRTQTTRETIPNSSLNVSGYIFYSDAPKDTFKTKKLVKLGRLDNAEPIRQYNHWRWPPFTVQQRKKNIFKKYI